MSVVDNPDLMPISDALSAILQMAPKPTETEVVYLEHAVGRVLAESPIAAVDVPPADNSSMDGYAINSCSINEGGKTTFAVSQRVPAGRAPQPLVSGTAARIFTGAEIPQGADAIVIQENAQFDGEKVVMDGPVQVGQNIRAKGQDIKVGQVFLAKGVRLQAADVGVLASTGLDSIAVFRPIKVAIISTGDELVSPGESLAPGQIYNSNRFVLASLLTQMGCVPIDIGKVADTAEAVEEALEQAAEQADCIISTGGVSVGEEDHVKQSVERLGKLDVWRLKIKPGKPLAFGSVKETPFFGLPGNPASALITFCLLARPFLIRMQGAGYALPLAFNVPADFEHLKSGNRQEYMRARMEQGRIAVFHNQSSGILSSASWSNGLVVIPPGSVVHKGDLVSFIPFSELLG
ncbi:gephyrin-like molybdotransferase Glp [Neptunomonas japonica]|uniref:Molybdopterin molybdenumtransferase n=1 Tax=Neptunomonas japonica JAMM 1380 TaxID=1441457 RepID=A0A7R6SY36_9GAMM|nr:gephyrin-like molybdotransferase Glp [Neptunomonas japonica]BBB31322.1 molybdopterin molybdotransferase [Neptunomonas japonica JAMM 1380]